MTRTLLSWPTEPCSDIAFEQPLENMFSQASGFIWMDEEHALYFSVLHDFAGAPAKQHQKLPLPLELVMPLVYHLLRGVELDMRRVLV